MDNFKVITAYGSTSELDSLVSKARNEAIEFQSDLVLKCGESKENLHITNTNTSVQHFENGKSFFSIILSYRTSKKQKIVSY